MFPPILAVSRLLGILLLSIVLNFILMMLPASQRTRTIISSNVFRLILKLCGIHLDCKIPRAELQTPARLVVVANHVSYLDILVVSALRPCLFLAKKEVSRWPVFGWVARSLGCIFVHRESLGGRAAALRKCLFSSTRADIALFPEGTTTASLLPDLTSWAKGHAWLAQRSEAEAILCIGLIYENQKDRAWTDDMSLVPHLLKTLSLKSTTVTVTGAWVPVSRTVAPSDLAITTHQQLCMAVSYECS